VLFSGKETYIFKEMDYAFQIIYTLPMPDVQVLHLNSKENHVLFICNDEILLQHWKIETITNYSKYIFTLPINSHSTPEYSAQCPPSWLSLCYLLLT
jgi:hypothetical protein